MPNVTYLIGAGASAKTIPVVNHQRERIKHIFDILIQNSKANRQNLDKKLHIDLDIISSWAADLGWLLEEAGLYYSIDTLSRKYYLTGKYDYLKKLKGCIILYFTIEQFVFIEPLQVHKFQKEKIDNRYDSFFATIANRVNGQFSLNSSVKILSWNYDLQIELSLKRFLIEKTIFDIKQTYQIQPHQNPFNYDKTVSIDNNGFSVVKINGNAIWLRWAKTDFSIFDEYHNDVSQYTKPISQMSLKERLAFLVNEYKQFGKEDWDSLFIPYLNFAWEYNNSEYKDVYPGHGDVVSSIKTIASQTNVLVIIGYSFPVFNRDIDKMFFDSLQGSYLKSVYIQDINPTKIKTTMINAFQLFQKMEKNQADYMIKEVDNLDQFVIPYEL